MKLKNRLIFLASLGLTLIIFIFFVIGLKQDSLYTPSKHLSKDPINFIGIEFFSSNEIKFDDIINNKKFTIINIWSSWCVPCRKEHKFVNELKNLDNSILVGLNYKDNSINANSFLNELGNPYETIIKDTKGLIAIELGAYGVPETYIINNKDQIILKKFIGPLNKDRLKEINLILGL